MRVCTCTSVYLDVCVHVLLYIFIFVHKQGNLLVVCSEHSIGPCLLVSTCGVLK